MPEKHWCVIFKMKIYLELYDIHIKLPVNIGNTHECENFDSKLALTTLTGAFLAVQSLSDEFKT